MADADPDEELDSVDWVVRSELVVARLEPEAPPERETEGDEAAEPDKEPPMVGPVVVGGPLATVVAAMLLEATDSDEADCNELPDVGPSEFSREPAEVELDADIADSELTTLVGVDDMAAVVGTEATLVAELPVSVVASDVEA